LQVRAAPRGARIEDFPADAQAWADFASAKLIALPYAGPVLVGGWSFGGIIAYEVAQRFARSGREVGLVVLLDTRMPVPRPIRRRGSTRRGALHKGVRSLDRFLEHGGWRARLAYLRSRARRRHEKLSARAQRVGEWWRSDAAAALPAWTELAPADATFVTPTGRRITLLKRTIWVSYRKYRPTPSTFPVLLLRTAESQASAGEASLGWGPVLNGDFESVLVPGEHFTMFEETHLTTLVPRLAAALERASARPAKCAPEGLSV
jgi:thioesterase domain-containing protein